MKKYAQCESCVTFYLGQNEDYSPGGSISESSEKLLQRGGGGVCLYAVWVKGEVHADMYTFLHTFGLLLVSWRSLLVMRSRCHHEGFYSFSRYEEMQEFASHKIFSWKHPTIWRPVLPVFPEHRGPHSRAPPRALAGSVEGLQVMIQSLWRQTAGARLQLAAMVAILSDKGYVTSSLPYPNLLSTL